MKKISNLNIPKVNIKKKEAKKVFGNWLGKTIPQNEIATKLGFLLYQTGIPNTETCILEQNKENELQFNCRLKKQKRNIGISLIFEDVENFGDLIISTKEEIRTYEYHKQESKLLLRNRKKINELIKPSEQAQLHKPLIKQYSNHTGQN